MKHIIWYNQIIIVCIAMMILPHFANADPTVPFQLRNALTGKCLEVANGSPDNSAAIQQNSCRRAGDSLLDAQLFFYLARRRTDGGPGAFHVRSYLNLNKCFDVTNASHNNGTPIQQYSCRDGDDPLVEAQLWRPRSIRGHTQFQNVLSQKCLDVTNASRRDGVRIQQYSCRDDGDALVGAQLWNEVFWNSKSF